MPGERPSMGATLPLGLYGGIIAEVRVSHCVRSCLDKESILRLTDGMGGSQLGSSVHIPLGL